MRYKIDTKYNKTIDTTIYTVYSGPNLKDVKVYTKKGNTMSLDRLTEHELFLCQIREEANRG